jgi:hypothetical protein
MCPWPTASAVANLHRIIKLPLTPAARDALTPILECWKCIDEDISKCIVANSSCLHVFTRHGVVHAATLCHMFLFP